MNRFFKFWISYISYTAKSRLISGRKIRTQFDKKLYSARIKNTKLATELEKACQKDGFLTYAEYMHISQYGKYGYHQTHTYHGATDVFLRWTKPLITICKQEDYHHIVEFGCGDGELAHSVAKEITDFTLDWTGIDINESELKKASSRLASLYKTNFTFHTATTIENMKLKEKRIALFSYSLDSIPPEMMINTTDKLALPNAILGIVVKNGTLSEIVPTKTQLAKKSLAITKKGIRQGKKQFDFSSWKLLPHQRAYFPIGAYEIVQQYIKTLPPDSLLMIIDEFAPPALFTEHLCPPKDLDKYAPARSCTNIQKQYEQTGENILYFPSPLREYIQLVKTEGIRTVFYGPEHDLAKNIAAWKHQFFNTYAICYVIFGKKQVSRSARGNEFW